MKTIFTALGLFAFSIIGRAQVASDFTQTDINGTSHNLYTYLNAGKVVIVDMFATWCGPCWSFHQAHYLEEINAQFGPNGTNQVVVIAYEDDVSTTNADLNGTGSNTYGNWTTGISYFMINATQSLPAVYGDGYPTISVICPADKEIKDNLFNYSNITQMKNAVQTVINNCTATAIETAQKELIFSITPNPVNEVVTLQSSHNLVKAEIIDMNGKVVFSITNMIGSTQISVADLSEGVYFFRGTTLEGELLVEKFVKL